MHTLGHTGRRISLLKIDCEQCEYAHFGSFVGREAAFALWPYVDQMQLEVHDFVRKRTKLSTYLGLIDVIQNDLGMVLFHQEPNILATGCAFELAFVRRNEFTAEQTTIGNVNLPAVQGFSQSV
eukprot:Trichotokara_eunicae@DN6747_c0_g1_i1.p1